MNKSSKQIFILVFSCLAIVLTSTQARSWSHYAPGGLGIKNASTPPPGLWFYNYNVYYAADTTKDDNGDTVHVPETDISVYANVSQICWITDKKILGGNYGTDIFITFAYTDLKVDVAGDTVLDEDTFGFGDIFIDPFILMWHGPRYDAFVAAGAYIPTGDHDEATSPGKGYWTFMEQVGATLYLDPARTWTASARARFEQSTEDDDTDITPGDELVCEYGLGKDFLLTPNMLLTIGAAGYSYMQLSSDSGPDAATDKFSGHAIGPEIQLVLFKPFLKFDLRYEKEYAVKNATQGEVIGFNFAFSF